MMKKITALVIIFLFSMSGNFVFGQSDLMVKDSSGAILLQSGYSKTNSGHSAVSFGAGISYFRSVDMRFIWGKSEDGTSHTSDDTFYGLEMAVFPSKDWEGELVTTEIAFGVLKNSSSRINYRNYLLAFGISRNFGEENFVFRPSIGGGMSFLRTDNHSNASTFLLLSVAMGDVFFVRPSYSYFVTDSDHVFGIAAGILIH